MNYSVKKIAEIATRYSYKMEIVYVNNDKAFLSLSNNYFNSPYPSHITSVVRSASYVKRIFDCN